MAPWTFAVCFLVLVTLTCMSSIEGGHRRGGYYRRGKYPQLPSKRIGRYMYNRYKTGQWSSWGSWGSWSQCSLSGQQYRFRHRRCYDRRGWVVRARCPGVSSRKQITRCRAYFEWTTWGDWRGWGPCVGVCGERGVQKRTRYRSCKNKMRGKRNMAVLGDRNPRAVSTRRCVGNFSHTERRFCGDKMKGSGSTCRSYWGTWGVWGDCTTNCSVVGNRRRQRQLLCIYPNTQDNVKRETQMEGLDLRRRGSRTRYRTSYRYRYTRFYYSRIRCNSKRQSTQSKACIGKIPKGQSWTSWTAWSNNGTCSRSCGGGIRIKTRQRYCNGTDSGSSNSGFVSQKIQKKLYRCNTASCPVSGRYAWAEWGDWRNWGACVGACGEKGVQSRTRNRSCKAKKGHLYRYSRYRFRYRYRLTVSYWRCKGNHTQTEKQECGDQSTNSSDTCWSRWGAWDSWGDCQTNCGSIGVRKRQRPMLCVYSSTSSNVKRDSPDRGERRTQRSTVYTRRRSYYYKSYRSRYRYYNIRSRCSTKRTISQSRRCFGKFSGNTLSQWSSWSSNVTCSKSCGGGVMMAQRYRFCNGSRITQRKYLTCNTKSCPILGKYKWTTWGDWRGWGPCEGECGERGVQKRTRYRYCQMKTSYYRYGRNRMIVSSTNCVGNYSQTDRQNCGKTNIKFSETCPATWGNWASWTDCVTSCSSIGVRKRQRPLLCIYPDTTDTGFSRREALSRSEERSLRSMMYTRRYNYRGGYTRYRLRARCGGKKVKLQSKICFSKTSGPSWSDWSAWSNNGTCSKSCGGGYRIQARGRYCNGTETECKSSGCRRKTTQKKYVRCNMNSCTITNSSCSMVQRPGSLIGVSITSTYSIGYQRSYGRCEQSCLNDTKCVAIHYQYRYCFKYLNKTRIERDFGSRFADKVCNKTQAVDGRWGNWGSWITGKCSASCGNGTQIKTRTRTCNGPTNGGKPCSGSSTERIRVGCLMTQCPVDGVWQPWSVWEYGDCSVTCGNGTWVKARNRTCQGPFYGGKNCTGSDAETVAEDCEMNSCPVDGTWEAWSEWEDGDCSVTCGNGTVVKSRIRECDGPLDGGMDCVGPTVQNVTEVCEKFQCPIDGQWLEWTSWESAECSVTCGNGTLWKIRTRSCEGMDYGGKDCEGDSIQNMTEPCSMDPCLAATPPCRWDEWTAWGACSVTCGSGVKMSSRTRDIQQGADCGESLIQRRTEYCRERPCLITPSLSEKDSWILMQLMQIYKRMMLINQPCQTNDTIRHPANCSVYFECQDQQYVPRDCGNGEEYDERIELCTKETQQECNFTVPGSPTLEGNNDLYYVLNKEFMKKYHYDETDLPDKGLRMLEIIDRMFPDMYLAGVCEANVTKAHPFDCSRYLQCNQGMLQEQICEDGKEFDPATQRCLPGNHVICGHMTEDHPCEEMFGLYPSVSDCTQYHMCIYGRTHTYMCQKGYVFDAGIGYCRGRTEDDC